MMLRRLFFVGRIGSHFLRSVHNPRYEVHGKKIATGNPYDNRFISVVTIEDRKIVHWRDYMDSLAAFTAETDYV